MTTLIIQFAILLIASALIVLFLNKDYSVNWKSKKVFTYSKHGKIAFLIGLFCISLYIAILSFLYNFYFQIYFSSTINSFIEWILIPFISAILNLSIFYFTYFQFMFKKKNNIKDFVTTQQHIQ